MLPVCFFFVVAMINQNQFQQFAKQFRAGRMTLDEFSDQVFSGTRGEIHLEGGKRGKSRKAIPPPVSPEGSPNSFELLGVSLPKRPAVCHKGDFGRVLVIGGACGMAGAIGMAGLAALRSGAGLVKVAVPESVRAEAGALSPCLMTIGCRSVDGVFEAAAAKELFCESSWSDVIAMGPGMGRGAGPQEVAAKLYADVALPMVVDADALNSLVDAGCDWSQHNGPRVLTPHPGEFQRMTDAQADAPIKDRHDLEITAKSFASSAGAVVVLKGAPTYVTDGSREYRNDTGNPGMATAGSGDVLTGVITALIGQGLPVFEACALGVQVHGVAGDCCAESTGEVSMIATDVISHLGMAFKKIAQSASSVIGFQHG